MMRLLWIYIGLFVCLFFYCKKDDQVAERSPTPFLNEHTLWADSVLFNFNLEELFGQMIIWQSALENPEKEAELLQWVQNGQISGVLLKDIGLLHYLGLKEKLGQKTKAPLIWGTEEQVLLNNQFSDVTHFPTSASLAAIPNDSIKLELLGWYFDQMKALGINLSLPTISYSYELPVDASPIVDPIWAGLQDLRVIGVANTFRAADYFLLSDTCRTTTVLEQSYRRVVTQGASGFLVENDLFHHDSISSLPQNFLKTFFKEKLDFEGLLVAKLNPKTPLDKLLKAGVDLIITDSNPEEIMLQLSQALQAGQLPLEDLMDKVKKILQAKRWMNKEFRITEPPQKESKVLQASFRPIRSKGHLDTLDTKEKIWNHFKHPYWEILRQDVHRKAMILVNNAKDLLPFSYTYKRPFRLLHYGNKDLRGFNRAFKQYADYSSHHYPPDEQGRLTPLALHKKWRWTTIVTLDRIDLDTALNKPFIQSLNDLARHEKVVLINFGDTENLAYFDTTLTLIQAFQRDKANEKLAVEQLFGGVTLKGTIPYDVNTHFRKGVGIQLPKVRLGHARPEVVGIAPEKLVGIDAIMKTAIKDGAFPGCQVLVAKEGKVIFSKSYGFHTYQKQIAVKNDHLFDVASITKVAGTTLAAMQLYEKKKFGIDDRVKQHWEITGKSTIKNIPIRKLMTHQSGLQPNMPVVPYLLYRDVPNAGCDSFFCRNTNDTFSIQVADSFYFKKQLVDQVWKDIHLLRPGRRTRYRYSDVNFMLLQKIIELKTQVPLDQWLATNIYYPLGLRKSTYNPAQKFDKNIIAPTQKDTRWRQQLVHGYVHDETAALFGGVGGHAGLFSNAEELAILFQTLLNGGTYGGRRYFEPQTVQFFTSAKHGNHRGLGFDKPSFSKKTPVSKNASSKTFGHTGFTGTCVWADPEHDLIFIFLSNRIYPSVKNKKLFRSRIRERAHQVIYNALDTYKETVPSLKL